MVPSEFDDRAAAGVRAEKRHRQADRDVPQHHARLREESHPDPHPGRQEPRRLLRLSHSQGRPAAVRRSPHRSTISASSPTASASAGSTSTSCKASGFRVVTGSSYDGLFEMLVNNASTSFCARPSRCSTSTTSAKKRCRPAHRGLASFFITRCRCTSGSRRPPRGGAWPRARKKGCG